MSRPLQSPDRIGASPRAFLLDSLNLPAQSVYPRNSAGLDDDVRLISMINQRSGHNRRLGLGAKPDPRCVASSTPDCLESRTTFRTQVNTLGTYTYAHSVKTTMQPSARTTTATKDGRRALVQRMTTRVGVFVEIAAELRSDKHAIGCCHHWTVDFE